MSWCRVFTRKRKANVLKRLIFSLLFGWFVIFGFRQDESDFDFGEQLDRNNFEKYQVERVFSTEAKDDLKHTKLLNVLFERSKDKKSHNSSMVKSEKGSSRIHQDQSSETAKKPNIFGDRDVGEMGKAVSMPADLPFEVQQLVDEGWEKHAFNEYLSDLISVRRTLPDFRTEYCRNMESNYSKNLPATSVIIIFHNEAWSTLLR